VSENQLSGQLPAALANLGALETLLLHDNSFFGTIPLEFGRLKNLTYL
jgi:hypothetical protein